MNDSEKLEWQIKMLAAMKEHLRGAIGWPNCSADQIMAEIPRLYSELDKKELILPGMSYRDFFQSARRKYLEAEYNRILGL